MKWLLLWILFPLSAFAACTVSGTTYTAASTASSDVQACATLISGLSSGATATLVIPAGTSSWSSAVSLTVPANGSVTVQGQSVVTGSGDPYVCTSHTACFTATDSTEITAAADAVFLPTLDSGAFLRITGITWNNDYLTSSNGTIQINSPSGSIYPNAFVRIDHDHIIDTAIDSVTLGISDVWGVVDHNWFQDATGTCSGNNCAGTPMRINGDWADDGYTNWNNPDNMGTNQAVFVEANYYDTNALNLEGFFDCYWAAKIVQRFNTVINSQLGNCHGTDSGGRSPLYNIMYGNYVSMASAVSSQASLSNSRGGITIMLGNTGAGTATWVPTDLQYQRYNFENVTAETWGAALPGLNWTPVTVAGTTNTLNAPAWTATTSYVLHATAVLPGGCNVWATVAGTSAATAPSCPGYGSTVTDGTVTWQGVGGSTTAGPGGAGFCAANPDTACSSNSTCAALSAGDTCSRYFDTNGGVYPYRDQPCVGHNQQLVGCYAALNTGTGSSDFTTDSITSSVVVANRDYYNYTSSFTGATGTGAGTLASMPATCTTGVGYWATNQGSWNQSGNGFGNGVLYKCTSTNTWAALYTPYTYPDPLENPTTGPSVSPITSILLGKINTKQQPKLSEKNLLESRLKFSKLAVSIKWTEKRYGYIYNKQE